MVASYSSCNTYVYDIETAKQVIGLESNQASGEILFCAKDKSSVFAGSCLVTRLFTIPALFNRVRRCQPDQPSDKSPDVTSLHHSKRGPTHKVLRQQHRSVPPAFKLTLGDFELSGIECYGFNLLVLCRENDPLDGGSSGRRDELSGRSEWTLPVVRKYVSRVVIRASVWTLLWSCPLCHDQNNAK